MTTPTAGPRPRLVATGPGELLAVVPYRLGFHPRQSLVLLALDPPAPGGSRRRVGAVVRCDLPTGVEDAQELVDTAVRPFLPHCRPGPAGERTALVVVYDTTGVTEVTGDRPLRPGPAAGAVLAHLRTVLAGAGVDVHDVLLVTAGRRRSLTCPDPRCCPPRGVALEHPGDVPLTAEAVAGGSTAAPSRQAALPETGPVARDLVRVAARSRAEAGAHPRTATERWAAVAAFADARAAYEGPGVRRVDAVVAGRLLAALQDPAVRDAVLLDGCPAPQADPAVGALLAEGPPPPDRGPLVRAAVDREPDRGRTAAAARLAQDLARHAPGPVGAGAWAVAAWMHWSAGDGLRAAACTEAALQGDPGQRLAGLVQHALRLGLAVRGDRDGEDVDAGGEVLPDPPPRGV